MAAVKEMNDKARLVGINHVALEVGSIEEALSFYGRLFELSLRGRSGKMAFIDMGDQFINLSESRVQGRIATRRARTLNRAASLEVLCQSDRLPRRIASYLCPNYTT